MFKPGDLVEIVGQNIGMPGGPIQTPMIGKQFTLDEYQDKEHLRRTGHYPELPEDQPCGWWRLNGCMFVFHPSQLKLVAAVPDKAKQLHDFGNAVEKVLLKDLRKKASALKIVNYSRMPKAVLAVKVKENEGKAAVKKAVEAPKPSLYTLLMKAMALEAGKSDINNFFYKSNGVVKDAIGAACYARLNYSAEKTTELCIDVSYHYGNMGEDTKKLYQEWLTSFLTCPPFAGVFKETSFEQAMAEGLNAKCDEYSKSQVVCAAVAVRGFYEFPARQSVYKKLRKAGCTFTQSWFGSLIFTLNGDYTAPYGGHCVFSDTQCGVDSLKVSLKEGFKPVPPVESCSQSKSHYQIFDTFALKNGGQSFRTWIKAEHPQKEKRDGWSLNVAPYSLKKMLEIVSALT